MRYSPTPAGWAPTFTAGSTTPQPAHKPFVDRRRTRSRTNAIGQKNAAYRCERAGCYTITVGVHSRIICRSVCRGDGACTTHGVPAGVGLLYIRHTRHNGLPLSTRLHEVDTPPRNHPLQPVSPPSGSERDRRTVRSNWLRVFRLA